MITTLLWLGTGLVSWIVARAGVYWSDHLDYINWKGRHSRPFKVNFCEVTVRELILLCAMCLVGPLSLIGFLAGVIISASHTVWFVGSRLTRGIDGGKVAFRLCRK